LAIDQQRAHRPIETKKPLSALLERVIYLRQEVIAAGTYLRPKLRRREAGLSKPSTNQSAITLRRTATHRRIEGREEAGDFFSSSTNTSLALAAASAI
jgi:hypothetical protein